MRLGAASAIEKNFLGVIDVDVKSGEPKHAKEVKERLKALLHGTTLPVVQSGRGNGSRHLYILTPKPLVARKMYTSPDIVKVPMPGNIGMNPSKKEVAGLTQSEIDSGIRLRPAWEIGIMGEGQQVVLPPSIHPDSGKSYQWLRAFKPALALDFNEATLPVVDKPVEKSHNLNAKPTSDFAIEEVEIEWLPGIDDTIREMILTGEGVEDRSAMLLPIAAALLKADLTQNEILSVLTNPDTFIGEAAYHHAKTRDRARAAAWVMRYTLAKVVAQSAIGIFKATPIKDVTPLSAEERAEDEAGALEIKNNWRRDLETTRDDRVRGTLRTTVLILEIELGVDVVRRDVFAIRDF